MESALTKHILPRFGSLPLDAITESAVQEFAADLKQATFERRRKNGAPVAEFRKAWASACVAAGVGRMVCAKCGGQGTAKTCPACEVRTDYVGRIFHDLRRSGVRHMVRAGVPQNVAMRISGHKTASMFRRYDIANEEDLKQAMESLAKYHQSESKKAAR